MKLIFPSQQQLKQHSLSIDDTTARLHREDFQLSRMLKANLNDKKLQIWLVRFLTQHYTTTGPEFRVVDNAVL